MSYRIIIEDENGKKEKVLHMSEKSLLEYEIDIDTLIELASQNMSKSKYRIYCRCC